MTTPTARTSANGAQISDHAAVVGVFAALGDPTRAALLAELVAVGRGTATSLTPGKGMSRQAIDRHLHVLEHAGVLSSRRDGREGVYALEPATLARSAEWLQSLGRGWERQLLAVKAAVEGME